MSELENENTPPAGEEGGGEGTPAPAGWSGPSQDEWKAFVDRQTKIEQNLDELFREPEVEPPARNFEGVDMTDPRQVAMLVDSLVQERVAPMAPTLARTAKEQGRAEMLKLFGEYKKDPEVGDFDDELAERAAFYYFDQNGGDAEAATRDAAIYASQLRKAEREAGISEYREKNSKRDRFADLEGEAGTRGEAPAKSYDEVLDKWAAQDEVT